MINFTSKPRYMLDDLIRLVHALRAPGGCPWDAAQTHLSIRRNFLEEAYEACEALDCDDAAMLREELGDVLLQVLFHADIETGRGRMTIDDIADAECKKLIFRHPFLFGGEAESWDELKQKEKGQKTTGEAMAGVARSLPATWRAEKIQKKAAKTGFRWESAGQALDKLAEAARGRAGSHQHRRGAGRRAVRCGPRRLHAGTGPGAGAARGLRKIHQTLYRYGADGSCRRQAPGNAFERRAACRMERAETCRARR